jgi:hypothetical protein
VLAWPGFISTSGIAAFTGAAYGLGMLVLLNIRGGMNPARSLGSAIFDDTFIDDLGDKIDGTVD